MTVLTAGSDTCQHPHPLTPPPTHTHTLRVTFLPLRPISQLPEPASTRLKAGA